MKDNAKIQSSKDGSIKLSFQPFEGFWCVHKDQWLKRSIKFNYQSSLHDQKCYLTHYFRLFSYSYNCSHIVGGSF